MTNSEMQELKAMGSAIQKIAQKNGKFLSTKRYTADPHDGEISYGEGNPIIGMEKFLGYYDPSMNIAYSPSISMNTDFSVAKAFCRYSKSGKDSIMVDGTTNEKYLGRMEKALDLFRKENSIEGSFQFFLKRERRYKEAKGLGESAAVASATARALLGCVFGKEAVGDTAFVSRYARLVSGSGSRSAAGGISLWMSFPGIANEECYAERMEADYKGIKFFTIPEKSLIETISAHSAAVQSDFYKNWIFGKYNRIKALLENPFSAEDLLSMAEKDMFRLDGILMSSGFFVHNNSSMSNLGKFFDFKKSNDGVYVTADTGPSLVFFSKDERQLKELEAYLNPPNVLYGNAAVDFHMNPNQKDKEQADNYFSSLE
ncbi:mevalonate pyrophosphate decarboxylase [Candidatus Mancarchaeum acidiphilum]|uniref:Mevalonate pyrophosphate decarboxylase n=2 Tax=Candidatus Mancarchaeum acidiphilum TaxID=1920749 RepID=A0A218NMY3_9ARCH|nr:mevalonate pyrophosphate decarboxylase [Candidatus Mancarchaeum acidiphilum]